MHFRLFISSTFEDMKVERDLLKRIVFPKIKAELSKLGHSFLPIDLRWGVSDESSLDHSTMDICLSEIRRAKESTQKPNFLILLGQRYGWVPLPNKLTPQEYEALWGSMPDDYKELFHSQFIKDDNSLDGHYFLKKRTGNLIDNEVWQETVEKPLQTAIWRASKASGLPNADKYFLSATEHEIELGALGKDSDAEQVVYFKRTLRNVAECKRKTYFNVNENGETESNAESRLEALEAKLDERLSNQKIELAANMETGEFDSAYQDSFCEKIYEYLIKSMLSLIEENQDEMLNEINTHLKQARLIPAFNCQKAGSLADSFVKNSSGVALIRGNSGTGKTCLLTKLFNDCPHQKIIRYAGITKAAGDRVSLIVSLTKELNRLEGISIDAGGASPEKMLSAALAGFKGRLTVFIDDADLLENDGFSLVSMLKDIPENISFVLTAKKRYDSCMAVEISAPDGEEAKRFTESYFEREGRALSARQYESLKGTAQKCGNYSELSALCSIACVWGREDESDLSRSVPSIIMERLSALYGKNFASVTLALIARSRDGLTQDELSTILSGNAEVMTEYKRMYPKSPQTDMIPDIIITRFLADVAAHVKSAIDEANEYVSMPGSQLKDELLKTYGQSVALSLLAFWEKQELWLDDERLIPNRRMLRERPALLFQVKPGAVESFVSDYGVCEAMAYAGLAAEYAELAKDAKDAKAAALCRKTRENLHHLYRHPAVLYSSIMCDSSLTEDFRHYVAESSGREAWLELFDAKSHRRGSGYAQIVEATGYAVDGLRLYIDAGDIYVYDLEQQRLEPNAIPPDFFPYHITPAHKLIPKSQDLDDAPTKFSINAQKATLSCEISGDKAIVDNGAVYFIKGSKKTVVKLPEVKQIAKPYNISIYFSFFLLFSFIIGLGLDYRFFGKHVLSKIIDSGYLMAAAFVLLALVIIYIIAAIKRRAGLFYEISPGKTYFIKSVLACNGRLFALTSLGFVLSCTEKELDRRKPAMRYLNTITSPNFGEHILSKFTEYIEMCRDEQGNIILQSTYSFADRKDEERYGRDRYLTVLRGKKYKRVLTMTRKVILGGVTEVGGDTCCIYYKSRYIKPNELYMFNTRTGKSRLLASGLPYAAVFQADVFRGASVASIMTEKPTKQIIIMSIGEKAVKLSGFRKPDSAVSYLDDKIAVVCSRNPLKIESIETADNQRKMIKLPLEKHHWIRENNLLFAYNHDFQILFDIRKMKICRVLRGKSCFGRGLGFPRFLASAMLAVSLSFAFPQFLPALDIRYFIWAASLCLLIQLGHRKYDAEGDEAFKRAAFSENHKLATGSTVYDYVEGYTVSKHKIPLRLSWGEFFGSLFLYMFAVMFAGLVMSYISVAGDREISFSMLLLAPLLLFLFIFMFSIIFAGAYGALNFFKEKDWDESVKQLSSEIVEPTADGGNSYIKLYSPDGRPIAETVSAANILEAFSSPSGTSAVLLTGDSKALLTKIHSRAAVTEIETPPLYAKRRVSYISFKSFIFCLSVLMILCAVMVISSLPGGLLPITVGLAVLAFLWLINILIH